MEVPKLEETPVDSELYNIIIEDGFITIPRTNLVEISKDETKIKKLSDYSYFNYFVK